MKTLLASFILICCTISFYYAQEITLFNQFNGRYDYTAFGNTLNPYENNLVDFCETLTSSTATFTLPTGTSVHAAYLYWAGSGTGDIQITLNNTSFEADNTYLVTFNDSNFGSLTYFSCYTDITSFIRTTGNGTYEFANLDISNTLTTNEGYCYNRTNFAGWCVYVIYENNNLPLNQINLFQGLEIINQNVPEKTILLNNLNVLDNENAKIGFLAWEGDNSLNYGETLSINNNVLSNPPLNLSDNAFNGTNSFTNSTNFYNCDLDVYNIQDNISIGDTSAIIKITTGGYDTSSNYQADLIILNNIITVLNSQLPDATINATNVITPCNSRAIDLNYTVFNTNSTGVLPANTPISFYINGALIATSQTTTDLAIGASETNWITLTIPNTINSHFTLTLIIDDIGTGTGVVAETNENNNSYVFEIDLNLVTTTELPPLETCDTGFNIGIFNLTHAEDFLNLSTINTIEYYPSTEDLYNENNEIIAPTYYQNNSQPQNIYIKLINDTCFDIAKVPLLVKNCPPIIPDAFSPNNDGYNDWFNIQGLYDIFENHELQIYNRLGTLIFTGNNNKKWYGEANHGIDAKNKRVPTGTYFYRLNLNDTNYPKPLIGWVYVVW